MTDVEYTASSMGRKPVDEVTEEPLIQYATRLPEDVVTFLRSLGRGKAAKWLRDMIRAHMPAKRARRKT